MDSSIFDPKYMNDLKMLEQMSGKKIIPDLIKMYEKTAQDFLVQLDSLLKNENYSELQRLFHSMKSSSGNLGLVAMQKICADGEKACKDNSAGASHFFAEEVNKISKLVPEKLNQALEVLKKVE